MNIPLMARLRLETEMNKKDKIMATVSIFLFIVWLVAMLDMVF